MGGELAPTVAGLDDRTDSDLSHLKHVPLAHCGGYPLVAAGAACECFAATTWQGDYLLLCAFAAVGGVRLEYRARSEETLRPVESNHADWYGRLRWTSFGRRRTATWAMTIFGAPKVTERLGPGVGA